MQSRSQRSPNISSRWLLAALLVAGIGGCAKQNAGAGVEKPAAPESDENAVAVSAEPASLRTIADTIDALGRCEAVPERIASLTPAIEGQVQDILLPLGKPVKRGDPAIRLDLRIAEANLADKKATRDGLKASLKLLLAPPRPEELKSQELVVDQAKLAVDKARANVARLRPLVERKEISDAQMYEADLAVTQADVQLKAVEAQLAVLKLGPRPEAVEEAQTKITTADAAVDTAEAQLKLHTIESPIDGVFDSVACRLGQTVTAGSPIGEIVDTRQVHVLVWIAAREAARVHTGQKARIDSCGPPRDPGASSQVAETPVSGTVIFVGRVADPQTGNLPVRILVDNPGGRLTLGQTVSAAITVNEKSDVLAIPLAALFDAGEGITFNLVRDGKSVRAHPELGLRDRHWVEVIDTELGDKLKPGEMVIVEGGYNLPEGNKVKMESVPQSPATGNAP